MAVAKAVGMTSVKSSARLKLERIEHVGVGACFASDKLVSALGASTRRSACSLWQGPRVPSGGLGGCMSVVSLLCYMSADVGDVMRLCVSDCRGLTGSAVIFGCDLYAVAGKRTLRIISC